MDKAVALDDSCECQMTQDFDQATPLGKIERIVQEPSLMEVGENDDVKVHSPIKYVDQSYFSSP